MKTGILLFNLGGPLQVEDVKPFLYNLFSDPDILVGIPAPFRQALAFFISQIKGASSIKMYEQIGGGSPQYLWTKKQSDALNQNFPEMRIEIAMRAWNPNIETALKNLRFWGADQIIFLPLFPQFSTTTTGSCFKEAYRVLSKMHWSPQVREVRNWPDYPQYIDLLRLTIKEALDRAPQDVHLLFSAHSLPMKIIERGDPYPEEVQKTVAALTAGQPWQWSLAYQSRNGKLPWLTPYTEDEIVRLSQSGKKSLIVVPISFVSDHIETLYELDILYAKHARENGIESYTRTRVFNDDPRFISTLASLVKEQLKDDRSAQSSI